MEGTHTRVTRDEARGEIRRHSVYQIVPLLAGMLMMIASGSVYVVGSYDGDLQTTLGMSNTQVTGYGTLVSAGAWLTIIPMLFMDQFGPKVTVLIGAVLNLIGYIVISAAGYGDFESIPVVMFMAFVIGFGAAWTQAAAFITNSVNCLPRHRGVVVGLLQASCAFSGGLFSVINEIFGFSVQFFLLFIGLLMFFSILVAYPSNHRIHYADNNLYADTLFVLPLVIATFITGILIMWATVTDDEGLLVLVFVLFCFLFAGVIRMSTSMMKQYGIATVIPYPAIQKDDDDYFDLINFEFMDIDKNILNRDDEDGTDQETAPLIGGNESSHVSPEVVADSAVAATEEGEAPAPKAKKDKKIKDKDKDITTDTAAAAAAADVVPDGVADGATITPLVANVTVEDAVPTTPAASAEVNTAESEAATNATADVENVVAVVEIPIDNSFTLLEVVQTRQFWLLFIEFGIIVGVNTSIADSLSDIIDAYSTDGGYYTLKSDAQSLFSVFSGLGRLTFGMLSDYMVFHYNMSRYTLLSICFTALMIDCIFLAYVELSLFSLTMVVAGFSYGGGVAMVGIIVLNFVGPTNFGVIYGCINIAAIIGTEMMYGLALAQLYNYYNSDSGVCYNNRACFKTTFWLFSALCMLGVWISEYLCTQKNKMKKRQ